MDEYCSLCKRERGSQARGSLCGSCWFAYIRSLFPEEVLQETRGEIRLLEGRATWFLPEKPEKPEKEEVIQSSLF